MDKKIRTDIYNTLSNFLESYKAKDTQTLAGRYDISDGFLEEIYEMLDFIEDKSNLTLFPIEEMDKREGGKSNLEIFVMNNTDEVVGIEASLYERKEYFAVIKGEYYLNNHFPKFIFHYFST